MYILYMSNVFLINKGYTSVRYNINYIGRYVICLIKQYGLYMMRITIKLQTNM